MTITRIDIKGQTGLTATLTRTTSPSDIEPLGEYIEVEIRDHDGVRARHHVLANDRDDQYSMAECLQQMLDGYHGTNSEIHGYFGFIEKFAD